MLRWLRKKDPRRELQRRYETTMRDARDIQRRGDIVGYAARIADAERIRAELDRLDAGGTLDNPGRGS